MLLLQSTYIYVPVQYRCHVGFTRAHPCCHVCAQNVSLDYLNLSLASYEVNMDAFVAYRSRQLQAPRALIVDLSSTFSLPDTTRGEMATSESPLRDLKMVNHTELLYMYYKIVYITYCLAVCRHSFSHVWRSGPCLAVATCTRSTTDGVGDNPCMEEIW